MSQLDPNRRFQAALDRAQADWRAADPFVCAARAGCRVVPQDPTASVTDQSIVVEVPFFGMAHHIAHPNGAVTRSDSGQAAHTTVAILLLHYLLTADGTPPADQWVTFRELPEGLFYSQAFAGHAEGTLSVRFGGDPAAFRRAAGSVGGTVLDLAEAAFRFQALPRLAMAVLLWQGDDEFPAQTRVLFDAAAGHYLPTEDLAGTGDWLAHRLVHKAD